MDCNCSKLLYQSVACLFVYPESNELETFQECVAEFIKKCDDKNIDLHSTFQSSLAKTLNFLKENLKDFDVSLDRTVKFPNIQFNFESKKKTQDCSDQICHLLNDDFIVLLFKNNMGCDILVSSISSPVSSPVLSRSPHTILKKSNSFATLSKILFKPLRRSKSF